MSSQSIEQRISVAQKNLEGLHQSIQRSNRITMVVAVLLLVLISGYFYYGYTEISALLEPDLLVPLAAGILDEQIPEARKMLEKEIENSAVTWAEDVSEQMIGYTPDLRIELENYVLKQTEELVNQATTMSEREFKTFVDDNRQTIDTALVELSDNAKLSEELLLLLVTAIEKELKADLEEEARTVLNTLIGLNEKIAALKKGEKLNYQSRLERRIIMIIRRLQKDQLKEPLNIDTTNEINIEL